MEPKHIKSEKTSGSAAKERTSHAHAMGRYVEGIGRRKTAVARVRIAKGAGEMWVGSRDIKEYFPMQRLQQIVRAPLEQLKIVGEYNVSIQVKGGGPKAQAEAVRHGLSRALVITDEGFKRRLRGLGFLTRDSRMVERKKYGLKKARRAPQWAKR